jgi:hypothetical protein
MIFVLIPRRRAATNPESMGTITIEAVDLGSGPLAGPE